MNIPLADGIAVRDARCISTNDKLNAKGGVNGRKITLISADDGAARRTTAIGINSTYSRVFFRSPRVCPKIDP